MARILALIVGLLLLCEAVDAQIPDQREALKNLRLASRVLVEVSDSDFEKLAVSAEQVRTNIEVKLRQAGVFFNPSTKAYPKMIVTIGAVRSEHSSLWSYHITIQIITLVDKELDPSKEGQFIFASIWEANERGIIGTGRIPELRNSIDDVVNQFVNDYLATNPKRPDELDKLIESLPKKKP